MSSGQTLHLFVDTNLFIQCPSLETLDWKLFDTGDCSAVTLIVSRPVQREIDNQKGKGGTRVGSKARVAAALFREIILNQTEHVVREAGPRVTVTVDAHTKPDPSLKDELDYSQRDDELVGTLASFVREHPGVPCALLTHDTGPMASAQAHHLPFKPIPDDWLLAPETTEQDKKIKKLEDEVRRLMRDAPSFEITCVGQDDATGRLELAYARYAPLTDGDVASLVSRLKERFPIATDFGSRDAAERPSLTISFISGLKDMYEPADQRDIDEYTKKAYPEWLAACEKGLRDLHKALQAREEVPLCRFAARNTGTRPATDALISIEAQGRFNVDRPPRNEDKEDAPLELPRPPKVPQGYWRSQLVPKDALASLAQFHRAFAGHDYLLNPRHDLGPYLDRGRDPNDFYYKSVSSRAGDALQFTCDQWRHGVDPETFSAAIDVPPDAAEVAGAIRFRIDAKNLPDADILLVPLRLTVSHADTMAIARNLIEHVGSSADPVLSRR